MEQTQKVKIFQFGWRGYNAEDSVGDSINLFLEDHPEYRVASVDVLWSRFLDSRDNETKPTGEVLVVFEKMIFEAVQDS